MKVKLLILVLLTLSSVCFAQESNNDSVKVFAGYTNLRSDSVALLGFPINIEENHGVTGSLDVKAFSSGKFRAGALAEFSTNVKPTRYHQYLGGSQLSYDLFRNKVSVLGSAKFGVHRISGTNRFLKSFGTGVDLNVAEYLFIRPFQWERLYINRAPVVINKFTVGLGFKF